ncbi:alanine racemase [Xenorhabdus nematophila]|uniref:Alanine racemase n=1 Tax=Xenorhabdus nematophila (strain ATCC 19061 / DSM 3370 / CCUG 14189 / LMG 1036 / NCIMB 9965 / AN6) TaxID=406817 RepID=D3VBV8_XENNA|nr:alanine racemase [Xenorhabdus nematophila]CEE92850.1 alanine racemase 1, PLP-binding, biosynthetic [Xenorhabdus nematophila str. Anatoliense]CEF33256.1 alanine racemase 1, PLP-binding, biosynthetic [Xenorhabdus nematophila str. Websteri]AYA42222.1 alanine racemase [Xenorhabdus nematophila]MBA0020947.1 alanine racemase [Xenorhabdus nematophila]MCB4426109.1 alanine racemase [Xenorhabdus nematophila]
MKAATAVINRRALRHNLQQVRAQAPDSKVIAVVKANAYGHGLLETACTMEDADCFGVARIGEALALRSGGLVKPILLLEGFFEAADLPVLVVNHIDTVVHSIEQLEALEQADLSHPIKVWMKLDTGMHRLGVRIDEAEAFYQRLSCCHNVEQPINLISHFSRADEPAVETTQQQIERFMAFVADKSGEKSIAASGGVLLWLQAHLDWVRPGIMMYGVSPMVDKTAADFNLIPAMTLKSSLIAVRKHKVGESVGYGGTWSSERDTCLGVVAMGYGDGYPRSAPTGMPVFINDREVPIVGRVSMDMITVDLGPACQDKVGDEVILWGSALPVEKIAEHSGISAYELITKLTSRVAMEYLDE